MSVLLEFAIFPTDQGESVSEHVSKVIETIRGTGFIYQLTSMGTIVETENFEEATTILNLCYNVLEPFSNRVYCTAKFDVRKGRSNRIIEKVRTIEAMIGTNDH